MRLCSGLLAARDPRASDVRGTNWLPSARPAAGPVAGEGLGERGGGLPAEAGAGSFGVIILAPCGQCDTGMVQGREQGFVQQLIAQTTVEAFDEGVLGRFSGRDVMPVKLAIIDKLQDRVRGELGPIIADNRLERPAGVEQG